MQPPHLLGGLDVHRVLRLDFLRRVAGDEAEALDVLVQVLQLEFRMRSRVQVVEPELRKVRDQNVFREVPVGNPGKVVEGLHESAVEILAA